MRTRLDIRDRIKELRRVPANELRPNPRNWRKHPEKQLNAIRGVLAEVGFAGAQIARELEDGTLELIDGHARAEVAGTAEVPVLILDVDEVEANKILATFDPIGAMAESDAVKLDQVLRDVDTGSEAVQEMLAELATDADLYLDDKPEIVEDEVPEPPSDPITKPGDLWTLGRHRLLCGDSTSESDVARLMNQQTAEMLFTDPPYGVTFVGTKGTFYGNGKKFAKPGKPNTAEMIVNDDIRGERITELFESALSKSQKHLSLKAALYIFFSVNRIFETLPAIHRTDLTIRNFLVWDKGNVGFHALGAQYKPNYEMFLYCHKTKNSPRWFGEQKEQTIWRHNSERLGFHPTMKPISLISQAINNSTQKNDLILDPFLGSGSTLIAAEQLDRTCYGLEISPEYCDVIVERWQNLTGEKATRENGTA